MSLDVRRVRVGQLVPGGGPRATLSRYLPIAEHGAGAAGRRADVGVTGVLS
jgi:hypothetical protein